MAQTLRLFVSATADLVAQRGIIGRVLAGLPVQVGAEIRRYPTEGASFETLFELISNVDRVYFLMGQDITAPAGSEWDLAVRLQRPLVPLRSPRRLTPAAAQFVRAAAAEWKLFHSDAELAQIVGLDLIDVLLHPYNRYGLTVSEVEQLRRRQQALAGGAPKIEAAPGGAENAAIIMGRDSFA